MPWIIALAIASAIDLAGLARSVSLCAALSSIFQVFLALKAIKHVSFYRVPGRTSAVKSKKSGLLHSQGLVDLHFHGAFGIDLITAEFRSLDRLAELLWQKGTAAFCPTTLSLPKKDLLSSVKRLGAWIRKKRSQPDPVSAYPLGIHLEGPFIHPLACGAHPSRNLRKKLDLTELESLWQASQATIQIITIAPELLEPAELKALVSWAGIRHIRLSIGHSKATETQARIAFKSGFSGVTHSWNALSFHHREAGVLGAALGKAAEKACGHRLYPELILDQQHVCPTVIDWTLQLHPQGVCFVSDCVPAAGTAKETLHSFGPLKIKFSQGACRLPNGHLAGGGYLLSEAYGRWIQTQHSRTGEKEQVILQNTWAHLTTIPLQALGLSPKILSSYQVVWRRNSKGLFAPIPVD